MKKFISLTFKITSFSTTVVLLITIFVALIVYFSTSSFFTKIAIKNINNEAKLIANNIENSFIKINNDINVLIKTPPIQGIVRSTFNKGADTVGNSNLSMWEDRLKTIFRSMLEQNKNYTQIRYIGINDHGKEIVRVNQTDQGIYSVSSGALQKKYETDYFKKGTELSQGSVMFSNISYNVENDKVEYPLVPTLRAVTPVYTDNHNIFGMLVINVNVLRYMRNILLRSASGYDVILFNQFNDFFIFNHDTKTLKFLNRNQPIEQGILGSQSIKYTKQIIPFLKENKDRVTILQPVYSNVNKDQKVFTVAISISKSHLKLEDSSLISTILSWVVSLCLLSSLVIFIFIKRTMKPLSRMTEVIKSSERMADKKIYLPTHLNDEVGLLARAFEAKTKLLSKLALFDSLTGLPNRKNFIDRLGDSIQHAKRQNLMFGLLYLDINNFKEVNDSYGHDYGDDLLIKFSHELKNMIRGDDYCARLGGDEFVVIIHDINSESDIITSIKRYEKTLNNTYIVKGIALNVLISGGVSIYPKNSISSDELIHYADETMYQSKKEGKGRIHLFKTGIKE